MKMVITLVLLTGVSSTYAFQQESATVETPSRPVVTVQEAVPVPGPAPAVEVVPGMTTPSIATTFSRGYAYGYGGGQTSEAQREAEQELAEATRELKQAESDDERADAVAKVEAALEKVYDERLNAYEKHLEDLEDKLNEMKKQVNKRRDARDEMVELRLKMMLHEVDGLGWPDRTPPGFSQMWRLSAPAVPSGAPSAISSGSGRGR